MEDHFNKVLDRCIDRINRGEDIGSCLADYPDYADRLKALLQAVVKTREAYMFTPSPGAKRAHRERFNAASREIRLRRSEKKPLFGWFQGQSRVWATATAVLLIAIITYFGIRPALFPEGPAPYPAPGPVASAPPAGQVPVTPVPLPNPSPDVIVALPSSEGNFAFLISDDVNAIADFESVTVSILKTSLIKNGGSSQTVEFVPEIGEVDLTLVQGEETQEIWRGNIPEGEYSGVTLQVSHVFGVLKETKEEVEIKLPSEKLHISKRFEVSADTLTSFTYDITVVAAGNSGNGVKYILKPQADQSGADQNPAEHREKPEKGKPEK